MWGSLHQDKGFLSMTVPSSEFGGCNLSYQGEALHSGGIELKSCTFE